MAKDVRYLVAYDLSDDDEREKARRLLQGYGVRAQYSVFECRLTRSGLARLEKALEALQMESGFVSIYRLQARSKVRHHGCPPVPRDAEPGSDDAYAWFIR